MVTPMISSEFLQMGFEYMGCPHYLRATGWSASRATTSRWVMISETCVIEIRTRVASRARV